MAKKMNVASFIGKKSIDDAMIENFENDGLPIKYVGFYEEENIDIASYDAFVFVELWKDGDRAERLLELAQAAHKEQKYIIWLVHVDDQEWMEDVDRFLEGEYSYLLTRKEQTHPDDILDTLVTIHEKFQATDVKPKQKNAKKMDQINTQQTQESVWEDPGPGRIRATLELMKNNIPKIGRTATNDDDVAPVETELVSTNLPDNLVLENVIAVAGFSGAGVSHVAWNISELLKKPVVLIEGRTTGALASWLGRNIGGDLTSRSDFLNSGQGTQHTEYLDLALVADAPMSTEDVLKLSDIKKTVIVDCGDCKHEVFRRAKIKVFVSAPDPQYLSKEYPEQREAIWVLNKWPVGSALEVASVEQSFNRKFDLVVSQQMRHVMLSTWTRRAAINMESEIEVINKWSKLFGGE